CPCNDGAPFAGWPRPSRYTTRSEAIQSTWNFTTSDATSTTLATGYSISVGAVTGMQSTYAVVFALNAAAAARARSVRDQLRGALNPPKSARRGSHVPAIDVAVTSVGALRLAAE